MINYFRSKKKLIKEKNEIELKTIEKERKKALNDRISLINEYESKIILEAQKAADERERDMLLIMEKKENRIRELELELINRQASYKEFKAEVQDFEIIAQKIAIDINSAQAVVSALAGKFSGIEDAMCSIARKVSRKDKKMIEKGERN